MRFEFLCFSKRIWWLTSQWWWTTEEFHKYVRCKKTTQNGYAAGWWKLLQRIISVISIKTMHQALQDISKQAAGVAAYAGRDSPSPINDVKGLENYHKLW